MLGSIELNIDSTVGIVIVVIAAVIVSVFFVFRRGKWLEKCEREIREKIGSVDGKVLNIERRDFFSGLGPFAIVGKGKAVYRVEYQIRDQKKESWVRFGGLSGPDWRL